MLTPVLTEATNVPGTDGSGRASHGSRLPIGPGTRRAPADRGREVEEAVPLLTAVGHVHPAAGRDRAGADLLVDHGVEDGDGRADGEAGGRSALGVGPPDARAVGSAARPRRTGRSGRTADRRPRHRRGRRRWRSPSTVPGVPGTVVEVAVEVVVEPPWWWSSSSSWSPSRSPRWSLGDVGRRRASSSVVVAGVPAARTCAPAARCSDDDSMHTHHQQCRELRREVRAGSSGGW